MSSYRGAALYHPSTFVFLREYVALNTLVTFPNCDCPAWSDGDLLSKIGDDEVVIYSTSERYDNHADQDSGTFVKPRQTAQSFRSFLQAFRAHNEDSRSDDNWSAPDPDRSGCLERRGAPYCLAQSDCLRTHHPELLYQTSRASLLRARLSASIRTPSTFGSATSGRSPPHPQGPLRNKISSSSCAAQRALYLRAPCDAPQPHELRLPAARDAAFA